MADGKKVVKIEPGAQSSEQIHLKVRGLDSSIVHFHIKKHVQFSKLMSAYCDRTGLSMEIVRFVFDRKQILGTDTPIKLEMEESTIIEVYLEPEGA